MKTIFFLTKYSRKMASSRVRTFNYIEQGSFSNYQVLPFYCQFYENVIYKKDLYFRFIKLIFFFIAYFFRLYSLIFIIFKVKYKDVIYIEKELLPYGPPFIDRFFLKKIKKRARVIFDFDDLVFDFYNNIPFLKYLIKARSFLPTTYGSVILCGNHNLVDYFKVKNENDIDIVFLPSTFPFSDFQIGKKLERVTLGWIGNPFTVKYLDLFLNNLLSAGEFKFSLLLCGVSREHLNERFLNLEISFMDWSEKNEIYFLKIIDIGIMPLPDSHFEQFKSGYKIIQYFSFGIPVLCNPVGINKNYVVENFNGRFTNFSFEEVSTFVEFFKDNSVRLRENSHKSYMHNFNFKNNLLIWKKYICQNS